MDYLSGWTIFQILRWKDMRLRNYKGECYADVQHIIHANDDCSTTLDFTPPIMSHNGKFVDGWFLSTEQAT